MSGVTDVNIAEAPKRTTPTERYHELALAALHRTPQAKGETVEVSRNARGDYQYAVAGVVGEDEDLEAVALRVLSLARSLDEALPLSRKQHADRDYLANEIKPDTKAKR